MIPRPQIEVEPKAHSFSQLMRRLGETFAVRDVMVPLASIEYVAPDDEDTAKRLVAEKRYSVIPVSKDGSSFDYVFCTDATADVRSITFGRPTTVYDHVPDSTGLADAFFLFEHREWYFALRSNRVVGLMTYWAFNSREFRVQLYAGLSRVEELSRDALAKDRCGTSDPTGLHLSVDVLNTAQQRFDSSRSKMGGNRFVDELQFHHVHDALKKHARWRTFLEQRLGKLSNGKYDDVFNFTELRDTVMHGRVLFPTYQQFIQLSGMIDRIGDLISHLEAYNALPAVSCANE